ncbi:MAG: efflux RND transporter permease subunit [Gemmatimonadaceae bacterium]|nr:efflux RND transporter permease subunit [Gemmatimonadaceae bacterium]
MNVARFSVRNRPFMVVVLVALIALGIFSLRTIPRAEDPTFPMPTYVIAAVYPGASPVDLEQLVADPIEKRIKELDRLKAIRTTIEDGLATVEVEFDAEVDADAKYEEVLRELNALRPDLPDDLLRLETRQFDAGRVNIVQLALVSPTAPFAEMEREARRLKDRLSRIDGVRQVQTWAIPAREVTVSLDLGRMAQLRIPVSQVLQAIQSEDANIPGGSVDAGQRKFNVKTSGSYQTLEEVRETVVAGAAGATVRLQDVADVQWRYAEAKHLGRYNGERAAFITANMKNARNISQVRDEIYEVLDRFERDLPPTMTVARGFDQSRNVQARLQKLGGDFLLAILLVLVTLLPLGLRAAGVTMISIPLSLAIGISLLKAAGYTINQLSIVGFVIALGLLVDDSIVVVENIARFLREGHTRTRAAILATQQITVAVLGTTATLMFAFLPLLMLPGAVGQFIRGLPLAVTFTILASLLVSLTIIPFLSSVVLKEERDAHGNIFLRGLNRVIDATYSRLLHRALGKPRTTLAVAALLFVASLAAIPVVGFSLFPAAGTPQFMITVETPDGWSLGATNGVVQQIEKELLQRRDVRSVFANVGRGNPQVYYNVLPGGERPNVGALFVLLDAYDGRHTPVMLDSLRRRFDQIPNARILVKEFENGPPIEAPIALRLTGENLDTLRTLAERLEKVMATTAGTRDVVNPLRVNRTDLKLDIDRAKAGLLAIPTVEIDRTVRLGIAGLRAGSFRDHDGEEYDITVRLPRGEHQVLSALDQVHVASLSGAQVPLSQVATVRFESSPPRIVHQDAERAVTVTAYTETGFNTDRVTKAVLARIPDLDLPSGYRLVPAGELESRQESFGGLGTAIILATFGILAILILEFRTFKGMVIVASVIPLGIIGGIGALLLSGYTLSFTAVIGFVALIGIEIKNSILLVDFTNQLREEGMALYQAIETAGKIRFLPIVLTTLTAIGGLLPLAAQGSSLYSPLALVIIGGLISSTLLSRLVTPVMYMLLPPALGSAMDADTAEHRAVPAVLPPGVSTGEAGGAMT